MRYLLLILAVVLVPALRAQDSVIVIDPDAPPGDSTMVRGGPPPEIIAELIASFNDSATTRMEGDVTFPEGSSFSGQLALYRGSLRLAGHVTGSVTVINATCQWCLSSLAIMTLMAIVTVARLLRGD